MADTVIHGWIALSELTRFPVSGTPMCASVKFYFGSGRKRREMKGLGLSGC